MMITALLLLAAILAGAPSTGAEKKDLIENVRIYHMSCTRIHLYWDWDSDIEQKPQFAVSWMNLLDGKTISTVSSERFASLAVHPASEYLVEIRALWTDSGAKLESEPTTVKLTALAKDWPTPGNISYTLIEREDDNIVYSLSWDQEVPETLMSFRIQICSRFTCDLIRSRERSLRVSLDYASDYDVLIYSDYNLGRENQIGVLEVRKAPEFSFVTESGAPSRVRNLNVSIAYGEDGFLSPGNQFLRITWTPPEKKRGPLSGYLIRVSYGNGSVDYSTETTDFLAPVPEYNTRCEVVVRAYNNALNGLKNLGDPRRSSIRTPSRKPSSPMRSWIGACVLGLLVSLSLIFIHKIYSRSRSSDGSVVLHHVATPAEEP